MTETQTRPATFVHTPSPTAWQQVNSHTNELPVGPQTLTQEGAAFLHITAYSSQILSVFGFQLHKFCLLCIFFLCLHFYNVSFLKIFFFLLPNIICSKLSFRFTSPKEWPPTPQLLQLIKLLLSLLSCFSPSTYLKGFIMFAL